MQPMEPVDALQSTEAMLKGPRATSHACGEVARLGRATEQIVSGGSVTRALTVGSALDACPEGVLAAVPQMPLAQAAAAVSTVAMRAWRPPGTLLTGRWRRRRGRSLLAPEGLPGGIELGGHEVEGVVVVGALAEACGVRANTELAPRGVDRGAD